ncbi:MAG: DoxX family protein [Chryseobacterium sp.]|jgi:uncharacterized membrane protein|uniref:DoxX family protein n=1 Tax=Chryseobacterium sp. TaxID=1871047 RepID=UPI00282D80EC|nr:DoxX family protein [Chryseobacterium sp.]MDR2238354.1 DoxX family protein [Chryseobacterium sp.]
MSKKYLSGILEWSFVVFVAFNMAIYGSAKYVQFGDISQYTRPLFSYDGMNLMWAFYAYSQSYSVILGIFEILGALLLLIPKTRLIGCFVLSSILINIILQDYFYGVHRGALANAVFYQLLVMGVLWFNREKLMLMIKSAAIEFNIPGTRKILSILFILGLFVVLAVLQEALGSLLKFLKI